MSTNSSISPQSQGRWLAIALIVIFAIATFVLTRPQVGTASFSSVSGLMTLKAAAATADSYDGAMANSKPTLIEFYADWCTTCQGLAPTLASVHQEFASEMNMVMLNIDDPQWRSQIQQFHVNGVPHIVLLDANHSVTDTFVGNVPRITLRDRVAQLFG